MDVWHDAETEAHFNFRLQLEMPALKRLLEDTERLAALRYDIEQLEWNKKTFKHALFELKVDLDEAVLKASRPDWDSEDEEKNAEPADDDVAKVRAKRMERFTFTKKNTESCNSVD